MTALTTKLTEPKLPEPELKFHSLANLFPPMEGESVTGSGATGSACAFSPHSPPQAQWK
jgi:hypothetical protein